MSNLDQISTGIRKHPRAISKTISYGTAGFRDEGILLDHIFYRMGILAALRSKKTLSAIGVMITASHNPENDNGIKIVDPDGSMLESSWEPLATEIANVSDDSLLDKFLFLIKSQEIDLNVQARVVIARDTRPSSVQLAHSLMDGLEIFSALYVNYDLLTTPQLHYMVRCVNTNDEYGNPSEKGYYEKFSKAFVKLNMGMRTFNKYTPCLNIDASNGVGGPKFIEFLKYLPNNFKFSVYNDGSAGQLNYQCGADFVKSNNCAPNGISCSPELRYASFDGDADRIVFYYVNDNLEFCLLDGDRIATLLAKLIIDLLNKTSLDLNLAIIQTAYANGGSTAYIQNELKVPVVCVSTGVKHLHHEAKKFDIGVYFEANGHGTILFSQSAEIKIRNAEKDNCLSQDEKDALNCLVNIIDLTNQTIGDAISDLLLVEIALQYNDWNFSDWYSVYVDLPNKQMKVKVLDRNVIKTVDAERKVISPDGLQNEIDKLVSQFKCGRSFVRPSGTEDVVRVYAEADTRHNMNNLALAVSSVVHELAGGCGDKPSLH